MCFVELKPFEELIIKKVNKEELCKEVERRSYKEICIVTGERNIFEEKYKFINAFKKAVDLNPALKIKIIGHFEEQFKEDIKKKIEDIGKNVQIYTVKKRPKIHFSLLKTKSNETYLHLQRRHLPGESKDEWIIKNSIYLKRIHALRFRWLRFLAKNFLPEQKA